MAGRTYTIDLRGRPTADGTLSDPYLRGIHDAQGNLLSGTTNDDWGGTYNSRVTFTATETGTHYIAAGAFSSRQGTYEVEVTDNSPAPPSAPAPEPPATPLQQTTPQTRSPPERIAADRPGRGWRDGHGQHRERGRPRLVRRRAGRGAHLHHRSAGPPHR